MYFQLVAYTLKMKNWFFRKLFFQEVRNRCESKRFLQKMSYVSRLGLPDGCPCAFRLSDCDEKRRLLFHEF